MVQLIYNQDSRLGRLTAGEKRLVKVLQAKLEDDYWCWCNVPIGAPPRYPDFILLHPGRGVLILEVKDWKLDTLQQIDKWQVTLLTGGRPTRTANPLEQARQYVLKLVDQLQQDPALRHPADHPHAGKLCCPFGYGVVLTNISRRQFESTDLGEVLPPERVICQDEMTEAVDAEDLQTRLWNLFPYCFGQLLSLPQIDRIRWHVFPEIRVGGQRSLLPDDRVDESATTTTTLPDVVKVMDLEQEKLARRLGEGHRVIHGVAGSGKTMILGYRCQHLARELHKPILVLCYNVALAARLRWMIAEQGLDRQVSVRHFHGWCTDQLRLYHVPKPAPGDDYAERLVQQVIEAVDRDRIPRAQYGAVLIDEGHDFQPEWFRLVVQMVDPDSNRLLVLYDDAQSIYAKRARRKFSFRSVGIQARGRTTILELNYRNTAEVLTLAYEFAREVLTPETGEDDGIPLIEPRACERHGPLPEIVRLPDFRAETTFLIERLGSLHRGGTPWNDMAVIYRTHFMGETISEGLRAAGIPVEWLHRDRNSRHYRPDEPSVKVLTMHASKGLEFPVVAIPGLGYLPHQRDDPADEARLLYVAMTRAMERLLLTHHRETPFTERLNHALSKVAA